MRIPEGNPCVPDKDEVYVTIHWTTANWQHSSSLFCAPAEANSWLMSLTPPKSTLLNLGHLSQARSASTGYHKKSVEIFGLGKQGAAAQDLRVHRRRGRKRERRQGLRRGGEGWRRSFAAQTRGTVRKRGLLLIICFKKFLFVFFTKTFTSSFFKKTKSRCRRSTTHKFRSAKGLRTKKQGSSKKQES